jgi:hypothetical protein
MSTDVIFGRGDDQLISQFDVSFPGGIPTGGGGENISLRVDLGFTFPEQSVGTYDIHKKGMVVTKTNTQTTTSKQFPLEWTVDQDWVTFDDMKKWADSVYDPIKGVALPESSVRGTLLVSMLDTQNNVKKKVRFKNCKPINYTLTGLDNAGSDPLRCTMTFIYVDFIVE